MNLLLISGSLRKGSYNKSIIDFIAEYCKKTEKISPMIYEELGVLPIFTPDLDIHDLGKDKSPQKVKELRYAVKSADAVLIATPEYAFEIPGGLKNALDWLVSSGEFVDKPVSVLSASTSEMGGKSANEVLMKLVHILSGVNPHEKMLAVGRVNKKIINEKPNEELQRLLQKRIEELCGFIKSKSCIA
jgi:chromate reductase, NAD(P)H dehydrogenase (quinone)